MNALYQMRMINTSRVGCNPSVLEVNKEINIQMHLLNHTDDGYMFHA